MTKRILLLLLTLALLLTVACTPGEQPTTGTSNTTETTNTSDTTGTTGTQEWFGINGCDIGIYKGFENYEMTEEADDVYTKTITMLAEGIKRDGSMCESYHPDTGEGILHRMFFSWNMLAASMIFEKHKKTRLEEKDK